MTNDFKNIYFCIQNPDDMPQNKTKETDVSVADFIHSFVDSEKKKADSFKLIELMSDWSGFPPKMWGPTIIGFGSYHYKYASGHEGDSPLIGFSPRKAEFSLYVFSPVDEQIGILEQLGKFKKSKACIYIKKLDDINIDVLEKLCKSSISYINVHHECACRER